MVLGVRKDGEDILVHNDISYSHVSGYSYGIPFIVELGAMQHLVNTDSLVIGDEFTVAIKYGKPIELTLSKINPNQNTVEGQSSTSFTFMHKESYQLQNNLYKPTDKVWGIDLDKYIIGRKNQLEIAIFELRKKGLMLSVDSDSKVTQRHAKEHKDDEDLYVELQSDIKRVNMASKRRNYSSMKEATKNGGGRPKYIPELTKGEVEALDIFIEAQMIIQSDGENIDLFIGRGVQYENERYCIMEKNAIYISKKHKTVFTLGIIPE